MDQRLSSRLQISPPEPDARRLTARQVDRREMNREPAAQTHHTPDGPRLLRFPAMQKRVGMGRTAIYELIKAGKFPRPVKVGGASAWIDVEITSWIEELASEREKLR